jgi:hypothetical protein
MRFGKRKQIADLEAALAKTKGRLDESKRRLDDTKERLDLWQGRFEIFAKGPGAAMGLDGELAFVDESSSLLEYATLSAIRSLAPIRVDQPLVLISQIQRSGGTFLSQLFDGHPECHAHPHELHIGPASQKHVWPALDLTAPPDSWFDALQEESAVIAFRTGFTKPGAGTAEDVDAYPFLLPPGLQRTIFNHVSAEDAPRTQRDVMDRYFTSYFNGWLDNQNLYSEPKKIVTGFVPGLAANPGQLERFFADYPDGHLISIVREPRSWYASAVRHKSTRWTTLEEGCDQWRLSTQAAIAAAERWPDRRTAVVTFEQLVREPDAVFSAITDRVGIANAAAVPTFNGRPATANSSFPVKAAGVVAESAQRHETVGAAESDRIRALTHDLHVRALDTAIDAARR